MGGGGGITLSRLNPVSVPKENISGMPNLGRPIIRSTLEKASLARCAEIIGGAKAVMDITVTQLSHLHLTACKNK